MTKNRSKNLDEWLTKQQAAQFLGVAEKTIDRLAVRGQIEKATRKRIGLAPVVVFHPEELNRIKTARNQPAPPFVIPANGSGQEIQTVSRQSPAAMELAHAVGALVERIAPTTELKEPYSLTLKQAREVSGLPGSYIHEHFIKTGRAVKTGGGWRIARAELETFCRHLSNMSKEAVTHA